jgi:hypothetical protein
MKNNVLSRGVVLIVGVFIVSSIAIELLPSFLHDLNIDSKALSGGNKLLFILSVLSYWLYTRSLRNPNPNAFVRAVYGSMLIKMAVCLLATFIYLKVAVSVSKNAIIACLVLYVLYTIVEVAIITQLLKKSPKNA